MRTALTITSTALAGVALAVSLAGPASAASIYADIWYGGDQQGGENVGRLWWMNDRTSSLRTYGLTVNFYEHAYGAGMGLGTWQDQPDLRRFQFPFAPTLTWNDKISSWYTP